MTTVLTINSGSSTLKFGLYRVEPAGVATLLTDTTNGKPQAAIQQIRAALDRARLPMPDAIGHRIVHGGVHLCQHSRINSVVMRQLEDARGFAPLHMPVALALIRAAQDQWPQLPQVACFDTTFHRTLPDVARVLPIDKTLQGQGIQRYGFHGLSCESIVQQLVGALPEKLVIAHLGSGASITAVHAGKSIDTTMGLTPSGGVMMATRSGDLDPGVLLYLLREKHYDLAALTQLIDRCSGLLGVSGCYSDLRQLHAVAATNVDARLAIAMFCQSVKKHIAAMAAVLGGLDLLVFTGGIGEHDALVRGEICAGLAWLGVASNGSTKMQVLPAQENQQIACHTALRVAVGNEDAS